MERRQRPVISATSCFPPNLKAPVGASGIIIDSSMRTIRARPCAQQVDTDCADSRQGIGVNEGNGGDLWKDRVELFSTKHTLIVRAKEVLSLPFL